MTITSEPCPVCKAMTEIRPVSWDGTMWFHVICPRCGQYQIEYVAKAYLNIELDPTKAAILSHAIRRMQRNNEIPFLEQLTITHILEGSLPRPADQINNFIVWLGDNIPGLGEKLHVEGLVLQAEIGARTQEALVAIVNYLIEKNLVEGEKIGTVRGEPKQFHLTLTMEGWEYYENLKRGSVSSRKAFMAMQYGDPELDNIVAKYFVPAVEATGFQLYRLDHVHRAGLIDDQLAVEIRTSRFLIADLTHENKGAYWEAGFAKGLGKPVIYTCEKNKFEEKKTHFDTNHHKTIIWDKSNLEKATIELKSTIRETLPEDAKLTDD